MFLFMVKFKIFTDLEALRFVYDPHTSLSKSSAALVHIWSIALSAYDYEVEHIKGKQILHADYLSRMPR